VEQLPGTVIVVEGPSGQQIHGDPTVVPLACARVINRTDFGHEDSRLHRIRVVWRKLSERPLTTHSSRSPASVAMPADAPQATFAGHDPKMAAACSD